MSPYNFPSSHSHVLNLGNSQADDQKKLSEIGKYLLYLINKFNLQSPAVLGERNPAAKTNTYKTIYFRFVSQSSTNQSALF